MEVRPHIPKIKSYFKNIESEVAGQLDLAKQKVYVASAWFNNDNLFRKLIGLLRKEIEVVVITSNKENANENIEIYFSDFKELGGELFHVDFGDSYAIMHNKFCIIDSKTVITGSYNWTNNANRSEENIVIIEDENLAISYTQNFLKLRSFGTSVLSEDSDISIYFTSTKEHVTKENAFQLFWDVKNADIVTLDDLDVPKTGEKFVYRIEQDTSFRLSAYNNTGESKTKSVTVKLLEEPEIDYHLIVFDPYLDTPLNSEIYTKGQNIYVIPVGAKILIEWEIKHATEMMLRGYSTSIPSKSNAILTPRGTTQYKFEVSNIFYSKELTFTIHAIEIPRLKEILLPFPEIKTELTLNVHRTNVPSSFSLAGLSNKIYVPSTKSLQLSVLNHPKNNLSMIRKTLMAKGNELKNKIIEKLSEENNRLNK